MTKNYISIFIKDYISPNQIGFFHYFSIEGYCFSVQTLFDLLRCVVVGVFSNLFQNEDDFGKPQEFLKCILRKKCF